MESMNVRKSRKLIEPVGNHEPYWMSHVARIGTGVDLWGRVRELARTARVDIDAANTAWQNLEIYLRDFSLQMTRMLRYHSAPVLFRQMDDIPDWVNRPQDLSSDPYCWALLGSLEATTMLLGGMHAARSIHGADISRAGASLVAQFGTYHAKSCAAYEELRSLMVTICEEASPNSVALVIKDSSNGPILMVQYEQVQDAEIE